MSRVSRQNLPISSLSSSLPPSGWTGFRNPNRSHYHHTPRSTCTSPEPRTRRCIRRILLGRPDCGLRCHVHSFRPPPCAAFSCLVATPRLAHFSASSRSLLLHDEVHTLLHHLPRLLFGHMVSLLHIPCFRFLTPKHRSARLSILFIVIRITPHYTGGRRTLRFLAWSFGAAWGILVAQMLWVCEKKATWKVMHFLIFNVCHLTRL